MAEVSGSLPKALNKLGDKCKVVIPLYEDIPQELKKSLKFITSFFVPVSWRSQYCGVFSAKYDGVEYYLFTYNNKSDKTNTIISKLIDNSYQTTYDVNNQLMHDNKCVICKGDGKKMLDVDIDELMNIIKSSYLPTALIVDNETITNHYYRNNPVYGIDGYDIYTSLTYHNKELRIHLDSQTDIIYTDYCNVSFKNKDLYYGIFKKWNVLTENKYPLNIKLMISLHDNNVNINIDDSIKDDIIDFLINA